MSLRGLSLWGPVVTVLAVVAILSHMPSPPRPAGAPDWLLHGTEFFTVGLTLMRALAGGASRPVAFGAAVAALIGGISYGALDEFHQSFIVGRDASARDWGADSVGVVLGVAAVAGVSRLRRAGRGPVQVTLLTGPGCALCDEAKEVLTRMAREFPIRLQEKSIAADPSLESLYRRDIPVILIGGKRVSKGRVDERRLRAGLAARTVGRTA